MDAITSLNPAAGAQGTALVIAGANIDASALVRFAGLGRQITLVPDGIRPDEVDVRVPSFDGLAGTVQVSLVSDNDASNELPFELQAYPSVETDGPRVEQVYPLCSLGALKRLLSVAPDDTMDDAKLLAMIDGASIVITNECDVDFRPVIITGELRDGDGSPMLTLARTPIASVQALAIGGQALDPAEVKVYPHYIRFEETDEYNPRLRGSNRVFPRGNQNVRIDYTAGYTAVPGDLSYACILQVIFIQNTLQKQGVESETNQVANATTTYSQLPIAPAARRIINRYRRTKVAVI